MKQVRFKKSALATAISAAVLLPMFSMHAIAEETGTEKVEEDYQYETVEVTATRRSESIMDVPFNISAVSGSDLEDGNIVDAAEMLRNVAGITVVDRGYRNSGAVNGVIIRGVNVDSGANGDVALSAVPTVSTYINDTPLFANFILKDIQQAEVLRGPQGTLYGSGALAGTVRYRMNKPEHDETYGSASISNSVTEGSEGFNTNADVLLNLPVSERIAFRANAGVIRNDGVVDYANVYKLDANGAPVATGGDVTNGLPIYESVSDADTADIDYGRASLLIDATDELSLLLSYQAQHDEIGGRRQVTRGTNTTNGQVETYGDYENGAVVLEPSDRDVSLAALEVEWDLGFATMTSSTSDYSHEGNSISDNTGFYAKNGWFTGFYNGTPRPLAIADRGYSEEALVQEFRLVSADSDAIEWTLGAYYMDQDLVSKQDSYMPGFQEQAGGSFGSVSTDNDFTYRRNETFTDMAVFGEVTIHLADNFRTTLGARYFENEMVNDSVVGLPVYADYTDTSFKTTDNDTLFKINVSYDLSDDTMLYSTIAEGYRRGGANAVPLEGGFRESDAWLEYESDSAINYEVGVKGLIAGGSHTYTASVFLMDWDNPQLNTSTPDWGFFAVANGDSARTQGLELEMQGHLTKKLHYTLGYAYVKAELTGDFNKPAAWWAAEPLTLQAKDGSKLPSTPENTLSLAFDYNDSIGDGMLLTSTINAYYQSSSLNYLGESAKYSADIDGFAIFNATTKITYEDFQVSLFIKNILNEDGVTGLITENHMGTEPSENFLGNSSKDYISQPRTIGLYAGYSF